MVADIIMKKAEKSDEQNTLISIFIEKAKWQKDNNKKIWDIHQLTIKNLNIKYDYPNYYVGYIDKCILGGFLLIEHDRRYWPDNIEEKAFYVHKLVVRNKYAGQEYSRILLDWIINYSRKMGKDYVRLNFDDEIAYLKKLYLSTGFLIEKGAVNNSDEFILAKAEYRTQQPDRL